MRFEGGYLSPYFVTDPERMECVYEDVYVLIHNSKISDRRELTPMLKNVVKTGRPLLVVGEDVDGEALASLVFNKVGGTVKCVAVKVRGIADRPTAALQDIATLTNGRIIGDDLGVQIENVTLLDLGRAKRVTVDENHTTIECAPESKI
jgi:chaperonin GroEL